MKRTLLTILMLSLVYGICAAEPLEFKGVAMGATVDEFKAAATAGGDLSCIDEDKSGLKSCLGSTDVTYADQRILTISGDFLRDRLASVSIQTDGGTADIIRQAITSKYGNPTSRSQLRQTNDNGTHYSATLYEWKLKQGGRISVQDHPRPHNKVYVTLESPEKIAWFKRVNTATPKTKKDI